jgi:rare lipoprotein A
VAAVGPSGGLLAGKPSRLLASLIIAASCGLSACHHEEGLGRRIIPLGQPVPKGGGRYVVGQPYKINGRWYTPQNYSHYDKVGIASWYGDLFYGRYTANGEIFDSNRLSAANPTLPLPAYVKVTNLENGRTVVVRVNDRGPYHGERLIDLSRRSADVLGFRQKGTARVRVTYLGMAPLNGDDSYERRYLAAQGWTHYASAGTSQASDPIAVGSIPEPVRQPARPNTTTVAMRQVAPVRPQPAMPPAPPLQSAGGFSIQAGSFKMEENAARARQTLGDIAAVDVDPIAVGSDTYYRVRVGPFGDRASAEAALSRVTNAGYASARIVAH